MCTQAQLSAASTQHSKKGHGAAQPPTHPGQSGTTLADVLLPEALLPDGNTCHHAIVGESPGRQKMLVRQVSTGTAAPVDAAVEYDRPGQSAAKSRCPCLQAPAIIPLAMLHSWGALFACLREHCAHAEHIVTPFCVPGSPYPLFHRCASLLPRTGWLKRCKMQEQVLEQVQP